MDVRGFFKNVLTSEQKEASSTELTSDSTGASGTGVSGFFSNTTKFFDSVQMKKDDLFNDLSNKINSIKLPGDRVDKAKTKSKSRKKDTDENDSSASEYGDEGDPPMYAEETPVDRRLSVESVDSLPENEAKQCKSDIKNLVSLILEGRPIALELEENFQSYIKRHGGRSSFARELKTQLGTRSTLPRDVIMKAVDFIKHTLAGCDENDDFAPAYTLMQTSFTIYEERPPPEETTSVVLHYMYEHLKGQPIWQSMRFWNAAFFNTLQSERKKRRSISSELKREDALLAEDEMNTNMVYVTLSKFIGRMFVLGIDKEPCLDFLRKQITATELPTEKANILHQHLNKFYSDDLST